MRLSQYRPFVSRVSMTDLFPACVEVLSLFQRPLYYKNLTRLAIEHLGLACHKEVQRKCDEDVREKLLCKGIHGTAYIGAPYCYGVIRSWFRTGQGMFNADEIRIPGNASAGEEGAYESLMRPMVVRNPNADLARRNRAKARGLVIEQHVASWFSRQWPRLVLPPENKGKWDVPCDHDFRLRVGEKTWKVDVFGLPLNGSYESPHQKQVTDIHLGCRVDGGDIIWHSVIRGEDFHGFSAPVLADSPLNFVVWLHCVNDGIDYHAIANELRA